MRICAAGWIVLICAATPLFAGETELRGVLDRLSLDGTDDERASVSAEDVGAWVDEIMIAMPGSENPHLLQSAWYALIALHGLSGDWDAAIAACDQAIDAAPSEPIRIERLIDREAIVSARDADQPAARVAPRSAGRLITFTRIADRYTALCSKGLGPNDRAVLLRQIWWLGEQVEQSARDEGRADVLADVHRVLLRVIGDERAFLGDRAARLRYRWLRAKAGAAALRARDAPGALRLVHAGSAVPPSMHEFRGGISPRDGERAASTRALRPPRLRRGAPLGRS